MDRLIIYIYYHLHILSTYTCQDLIADPKIAQKGDVSILQKGGVLDLR